MPRMTRTACCLVALIGLCSSGCALGRWARPLEPAIVGTPLPPHSSVNDIVTCLNGNIEKVTSWRCTNVTITSRGAFGLPVSLSAQMAVEYPRNFRLQVAHGITGNEVDLGSNDERFWFWIRRAQPPALFTSKHEHAHAALQRMPIPFEPGWLIEALGVVPLEEHEFTVGSDAHNSNRVYLIRNRVSPQGQPVKMITAVNVQRGVIVEQSLYGPRDQLIARARLDKHFQDPVSHAILPRVVELDWPQANLGLTMHLGEIEVNPAVVSPHMFAMPHGNHQVIDLGQGARPATARNPHWSDELE